MFLGAEEQGFGETIQPHTRSSPLPLSVPRPLQWWPCPGAALSPQPHTPTGVDGQGSAPSWHPALGCRMGLVNAGFLS